MEEDIKILEDYIKLINKGYCNECNELCNIYGAPSYPSRAISQAIGNLLKAYKELKEENKETVKDNFRLKNKLETKRKEYQETYKDVREELKELKENNQIQQQQLNGAFDRGFIPVAKAKEKIEEITKQEKEELKGMKGQDRYYVKQMYNYKRQGIEELLGEE